MSGIVASISLDGRQAAFATEQMRRMLSLLTDPYGNLDTEEIALPSGAIGFMQRPPKKSKIVSKARNGSAVAVVDGHVYDATASFGSDAGRSLADQLLEHHRRNNGDLNLAGIDGLFAGVIVDLDSSTVTIFADQFGLRRLYYFVRDAVLYLSSEVKTFLALENGPSTIPQSSVSSFFVYGVLPENLTWLDGVNLVAPATVLKWRQDPNPESSSFRLRQSESPRRMTFEEACEEASGLFQRAVDKRRDGMDRVGVRLSGGLDSRAIVAALAARQFNCETFTFGRRGSLDGRIARQVSAAAGSLHHEHEFTSANWFQNRIGAVWISDGQLDVQNMHGMPDIFDYSHLDVHLCGDLGGGIIGGLFLDTWPSMSSTAVLNHRLRRFSGESSAYNFHFMDERCPFYDLDLLQFLSELPAGFLRDSRLYRRMLLKTYPRFYRTIPWQHTGLPIWFHDSVQNAVRLGLIATTRGLARFVDPKIDVAFHLNKLWFRLDPVRSIVHDLLLRERPLFADHLDLALSQNKVREHLEGRKNHVEFLSKLLTFELWLRSVQNRGPLLWN